MADKAIRSGLVPSADGAARERVAVEPALTVDVVAECPAWSKVRDLEGLITMSALAAFEAAGHAAGARGVGPAAVTVALLDDAEVRALNRQFRGQDKPTNVLSFPALAAHPQGDHPDGGESDSLGDIVLAYETVAAEAGQEGIALSDHIRHLVVHGVLHLLGFDHEADEEADRMEALETRVLARLGVADPYTR